MLKCSDKNGIAIQGNGQLYKFKENDAIPDRIFADDFPGDSGIDFKDALVKAGRIKESKKEELKDEKTSNKSNSSK